MATQLPAKLWAMLATLAPSDRISAAALIVSIVALALGLQQSLATRRHERLSVVPKLNTRWVDGSSGDFTGIAVENHGLGPARVLNIRLFVDGNFVAEAYDDNQWRKVFTALGNSHPPVRMFSAMTDVFVPVDESYPILWQRNEAMTDAAMAFY